MKIICFTGGIAKQHSNLSVERKTSKQVGQNQNNIWQN
jgi:hypothetical protein